MKTFRPHFFTILLVNCFLYSLISLDKSSAQGNITPQSNDSAQSTIDTTIQKVILVTEGKKNNIAAKVWTYPKDKDFYDYLRCILLYSILIRIFLSFLKAFKSDQVGDRRLFSSILKELNLGIENGERSVSSILKKLESDEECDKKLYLALAREVTIMKEIDKHGPTARFFRRWGRIICGRGTLSMSVTPDYLHTWILGVIELFCYSVLIATGNMLYVGAWMAFKGIALWSKWNDDRTIFNLFLIGNAIVVLAAAKLSLSIIIQ